LKFDRASWENVSLQNRTCPNCKNGILQRDKKDFIQRQTLESSEISIIDDPPYTEYRFACILRCPKCSENISVAGTVSYKDIIEAINFPGPEHELIRYSQVNFCPAIPIIEIPNKCPDEINKIVTKTFALFTIDLASTANKIRVALEMILDDQGVSRSGYLQDRINLFTKKNPGFKEYLHALKNVGNLGSHGDNVKLSDILDLFEVLEFLLEELYNPRRNRIVELSKSINARLEKKKV